MVKKPCIVSGCGELAAQGSRCKAHADAIRLPRERARDRARSKSRGSSAQRGYGYRYRKARAQAIEQEARCWVCGELFTDEDTRTGEHAIPLRHGGTDDRSNIHSAHSHCNFNWKNRT
jgi:5-methylcytosine-specific restriction protein A